ncbi:GntR family transcriptional regulator [Spongiactinospora sp. TRM90649]|uniref:GntR family transcriptional regulator n=1 Tax=Spongiactinospora sp. TRM90649 TaxID=3031114 RepID=UPI0023F6E6FE|nr:GntR family transcriptional regulator [Spongiactinospora sp. TRM90649]MDF5757979.1 GntR family transcriptional regulator [Spongiactinospora sp. TRM90649]
MFDDRSPIYRQIADKIKTDVLSGALDGDEQIMSTNQYAAFYRINPATAAKAFQQLVDEGVLYKKRGIGMFVSPTARDSLREQRRRRFFTDVVDPMMREARAIGVPVEEIVERMRALPAEGQA